jgi:hypothetical protein
MFGYAGSTGCIIGASGRELAFRGVAMALAAISVTAN